MNSQTAAQNIETFLAYAIALEEEAAERYEEQADAMDTHNKPDVGQAFHTMAGYCRKHADEIKVLAQEYTLPVLAPWEFDWDGPEAPETAGMDKVHYMMNTTHALQAAITNEKQAYEFYLGVSQATNSAGIRKLATAFAEEEQEHCHMLEQWLQSSPASAPDWEFDPDPAHMPE